MLGGGDKEATEHWRSSLKKVNRARSTLRFSHPLNNLERRMSLSQVPPPYLKPPPPFPSTHTHICIHALEYTLAHTPTPQQPKTSKLDFSEPFRRQC